MTKKLSELEIESIEQEADKAFREKISFVGEEEFDHLYSELFSKAALAEDRSRFPALEFLGVAPYDGLVTKIEPYFEGNSSDSSQAAKQALLNYRYYNDLAITAIDYFGTHYLTIWQAFHRGETPRVIFSTSIYQQFLSSIRLGLYTNPDYIVLGRYGLNYTDPRDPSPRLEALKDYLRQIYLWRKVVFHFQRKLNSFAGSGDDKTAHYSPEVWAEYQKVSKEHFINAFGSDKGQELFNKWVGSVKPADQGSFEKVQEQVFNVIAEELLKKQGVDLKPKSEEKKPSGMNRDYAKEVEENKKKDEEKKKREEERKKREETPPPPPKPKTPFRSPSPQPEPKPKPDDKEPEPQPEPKPEQEPPKKEDKGKEKEKRDKSPSRGESQKPPEDKTIPKETSFSTNLNDIINKLNANLNEDTQKNNPNPFEPSPGLGQPLTAMEKEEVKKLPWRVVNFGLTGSDWSLSTNNWFRGNGSMVPMNLGLNDILFDDKNLFTGQFKATFDNPEQKGYDLLKVDEEWRNKLIKEKFPNLSERERERERDKILFRLPPDGILESRSNRGFLGGRIYFETQARQESTRIFHWFKNVEDAYDLTTNDNLLGLLWNKNLRGRFSWFDKKAKWGTAPGKGCLLITNYNGVMRGIDLNNSYTYYFIFHSYNYPEYKKEDKKILEIMDGEKPRSISELIQKLNSKPTQTLCIGPDLLNLKETLTPNQKTKVKTVPKDKKDQAEKQVTDQELKAMNLTREDFNKLNTPFLDKATFWNILKKAVQADNPQAMEKLLNNLYDHLPVTSLTAMFNEMVDNNPVFNQEEKKKLKDLWEKAQSKEAKKKVWETLTSHQAQREAHNKKTQAEKDKIFEEQVNNNPAYGPPKADTQERRDKFKEYETADETKKAKMQEEENKKFTQGQNAFQWGDFFQAASTFHAGGGDDSINCEGDDVNTSFSWKDSIAAIHRLKDIVLLKPANMDAGMKANRPAWEVVMNNPLTYIFLFIGVVMAVLSKVFTK